MDIWCKRRTKSNLGIFEPESRLYMLIIPFLLTSAGCILFGYGVQETLSWVALFFGYGLISVALTAVSQNFTLTTLVIIAKGDFKDPDYYHGVRQ